MRDIARYLASLPPVQRKRGTILHELVRRRFPGVRCSMSRGMPTYELNGQFFACPRVATGVGCINLRDSDQVSLSDVEAVVTNALAPSRRLVQAEQRARTAAPGRREP